MPRKPPILTAGPLIAWLCLAATPIHADTFEQPEYKSRGIAFLFSVVGIAAPVTLAAHISNSTQGGSEAWVGGLAAGGMLLGPSLGQVYAGSHKEAWIGAGVRTGGAFAAMLGLSMVVDDLFCSTEAGEDCNDSPLGLPLYAVGLVSYVGGAIYSFVNADRSVERFNESQSRLGVIEWSPLLTPGKDGSMRAGALAYVRF